jgi:hypothetical protein
MREGQHVNKSKQMGAAERGCIQFGENNSAISTCHMICDVTIRSWDENVTCKVT